MILIVLIVLAILLYKYIKPPKTPQVLNVYFGVPGSGKTTFAAYLTKKSLSQSRLITWAEDHQELSFAQWLLKSGWFKRCTPVYSNVPITGAYELDAKEDIGNYMILDGKVIIDEAGIEYNNRNYKSFPPESIYWYKYHRHYRCSVDVFSQSYEDMDVTLRRLAQNFYVVKKSLIPYFITCRRIRRSVGIDEVSHQIIDCYRFGFPIIDTKRAFSPVLWKMFNSYSHKELPEKEWQAW